MAQFTRDFSRSRRPSRNSILIAALAAGLFPNVTFAVNVNVTLPAGSTYRVPAGSILSGRVTFQTQPNGAPRTKIFSEVGPLVLSDLTFQKTGTSTVFADIGAIDEPISVNADFSFIDSSDTVRLYGSEMQFAGRLRSGERASTGLELVSRSTIRSSAALTVPYLSKMAVSAPGGMTNTGVIEVGPYATLRVDGRLDNTGGSLVVRSNGKVSIDGNLTPDGVGGTTTFEDGSYLEARGTLDNTGRMLTIGPGSIPWAIAGTLRGGTLRTEPGHMLRVTADYNQVATIDDVVIDGRMQVSSGSLVVPAGQAFRGTGEIAMFGSALYGSGDTEISPELLVTSEPGFGITRIGRRGSATVSRGTLRGGSLELNGSTIKNLGTIETDGDVRFNATFTREDLGTLVAKNSGGFTIGGTLLNQGKRLAVGGANGNWRLVGTIVGGAVDVDPSSTMSLSRVFDGSSAVTLDGVELNGKFAVGTANYVSFADGLVAGQASIQLAPLSPGLLQNPTQLVGNAIKLEIGPNVVIESAAQNYHDAQPGYTGPAWYPLNGVKSFAALTNRGALLARRSGTRTIGGLYLSGTRIDNHGTIGVDSSGLLDVYGSLTMHEGSAFSVGVFDADPDDDESPLRSGLARVFGTLDLSTAGDRALITGTPLPFGTSFTFLTHSSERIGTFDFVTPGYLLEYLPNEIRAVSVPEPTGCLLVAAGLLSMTRRRP